MADDIELHSVKRHQGGEAGISFYGRTTWVSWEEVFGEPDHTHSLDPIWRYSAKCFTMWKALCYIISTAICGIPVATCWGCYFACVAFQHIWCITPQIRELTIECAVFQKMLKIMSDACIAPCCESCGAIFAFFKK